MVAFEEQSMAGQSSSDLEAVANQAQCQTMEVATDGCQCNDVFRFKNIEYTQEQLDRKSEYQDNTSD